MELLSLKILSVSDHVGTFTPDTIEKLKQERDLRKNTAEMVKNKEKTAYMIEYYIKFIYPAAFILFNLVYWVHYLSIYHEELW